MTNPTATAEKIKALPLFSRTESHTLTNWLRDHSSEPVKIPADQAIDKAGNLGILLEGCASVFSADSGRNVILRELSAPGIFGAASLFCLSDSPLSRIEAKTACSVLFLSVEAVYALMDLDPGFRNAYLAFLAGRVQFLNRKILCFTAGSAERRLALWLCSEDGDSVTLPSSMSALADMLSIGRASLYRALDKLEGDGLIRRDGRTITVISQEELLKKYQ